MFNGLGMYLGNLSRLSNAKTRSVSPENFNGEKGKGGMASEGNGKACADGLGVGWKISPSIVIAAGETREIANIDGPGALQHIWLTPTGVWRKTVIRFYWDGCEEPSVECPIGDFFASAYQNCGFSQVNSLAVCVNPGTAFNCYWEMPFRENCRITIENMNSEETVLYYQIDYTLTEIPDDCAYFHAQFRRVNPLPYKEVYTIVDGIKGKGQYVGTYMAWGVNNNGWWGEGEIKFYMDGDREFPTICGTGTEDYFCGSYNFDAGGKYVEFSTAYSGLSKVIRPDGLYSSQQRFSLYRWHISDPIRFEENLKVTIQALGWRGGGKYLPLQDDIASVAFWYQTLPCAKFPKLPDKDYLEII
jgi:hypothetical protein